MRVPGAARARATASGAPAGNGGRRRPDRRAISAPVRERCAQTSFSTAFGRSFATRMIGMPVWAFAWSSANARGRSSNG